MSWPMSLVLNAMAAMQRGCMGPEMGDGGGKLAKPIRPAADPQARFVEVKRAVKNANGFGLKGRIRVAEKAESVLESRGLTR